MLLLVEPPRRWVVFGVSAAPVRPSRKSRTFQRCPVIGSSRGGGCGCSGRDLLLDAVQMLQVLQIVGQLGRTAWSVREWSRRRVLMVSRPDRQVRQEPQTKKFPVNFMKPQFLKKSMTYRDHKDWWVSGPNPAVPSQSVQPGADDEDEEVDPWVCRWAKWARADALRNGDPTADDDGIVLTSSANLPTFLAPSVLSSSLASRLEMLKLDRLAGTAAGCDMGRIEWAAAVGLAIVSTDGDSTWLIVG